MSVGPQTPAARGAAATGTAPTAGRPVGYESPLPLLGVLAGALLLRLSGLGMRSIWTDEGSTWTAASAPLKELLRLCAQKDASPPLFYLLTSAAIHLFGDSEAWLRSVSVAASLGMVLLTYRLARLYASRSESTLAATLVALSPHQLMFAQEARTYMLVGCFATWSLYLFVRAVLFDRRRAWVPYVIVTALGLWTQSIALLGIGVQGAIVVFTADGRRNAWRWALALGAAILLYAPWIAISAAQTERLHQSHWYLQTPGGHELFQVVRAVFLSPISLVTPPPGSSLPGLEHFLPRKAAWLLLVVLPIVPFLFALRSSTGGTRRAAMVRFAYAALLLPLAAVYLVSFKMPLWLPRYFVFLTPMLALLLARGLWRMRPMLLTSVWTALLLASCAYACVRYAIDYDKEQWRRVVAHIASTSGPHAAALVPFDVDPFRYYDRRQPRPVDAFEVSHPDVPFASNYTERQLQEMVAAARERVRGYDEVWVVVRSPNSEVRLELSRRVTRLANEGRTLVGQEQWNSMSGPLRVAHYLRGGARPDSSAADSAAVQRPAARRAPSSARARARRS